MFFWLKYVDLSPYVEIIDDVAFNRCTDKFTTFQKDAQMSIQNRRASQFMYRHPKPICYKMQFNVNSLLNGYT